MSDVVDAMSLSEQVREVTSQLRLRMTFYCDARGHVTESFGSCLRATGLHVLTYVNLRLHVETVAKRAGLPLEASVALWCRAGGRAKA